MPRYESAPDKLGRGRALCVAADRRAAEAGASILRRGGNAFDAAAAAGFMEAVIAPASCGIGGYGASGVVFHAASNRLSAIDANAVAPAASAPDMFPVIPARDPNDFTFPNKNHRLGLRSVAVPGVLAGLIALVERWGKLKRAEVMAPAIAAASEGIPLTPGQALTWLSMVAESEGKSAPDRKSLPKVVPMDDLLATLDAVAKEGSEVFYSGRIGRAIAEDVRKRGGMLSTEDMAGYRVRVVEPNSINVRGIRLATPPPASGGLTSLQITGLIDRLVNSGRVMSYGSAEYFNAFLEAMKATWVERLTTLGDSATMNVDPASLLSDDHIDRLLDTVQAGLKAPKPGRIVAPDPLRGTVHLMAADSEGNVVSWTQTHGGGFGSGVIAKGTGVVLGHGMCRFEPRPGWANSIAPGKRPLHNMAPLIGLKDGRVVFAAGASGGRTIVNNSAAVAIARVLFGKSASESLAAPRIQCETIEPATMERAAGPDVVDRLRRLGHLVKDAAKDAGSAHLLVREEDSWIGAAEPRSADSAAIVA